MDLFAQNTGHLQPLAEQLRPHSLDEFVGQKHLLGPDKKLSKLIESGNIPSMIFWGPPGVGKTTLARILATKVKHAFITLSAVTSGIKEVKEVIKQAKGNLSLYSKKTILFIDEIHRFNKAQQDAFLPHVEDGTITLIGATTENPSFEVISALLSRCQVVVLESLSHEDLLQIIDRALDRTNHKPLLDDLGKNMLIENCHGDARYLINLLEDLLNLYPNETTIPVEQLEQTINKRASLYDKNGEHHYNVISAFIKSMRGSDPDAALYYLARMLEAGEDPMYIARRMVIFASEDIGNANPQAVQIATSCMQSYHLIGKAEGWIPLSHCVTYLAGSPKSNASYKAYKAALEDVRKHGALEVPLHLRNAPTKLMKNIGYGQDYKYAHDYEGSKVEQQCLPDELKNKKYYEPTENGFEIRIKEWLEKRASKSA
jgi:putative ATPase